MHELSIDPVNSVLHLGEIKGDFSICSLGHRFSIRETGASPDRCDLHLDPFPLLTQADRWVKVAIATDANTGRAEIPLRK